MKRWGRVAWDGLIMFRGARLMHKWERVSWFKLKEWRNVEENQKTKLVELVKKDISIKEVTKSMTLDRISFLIIW